MARLPLCALVVGLVATSSCRKVSESNAASEIAAADSAREPVKVNRTFDPELAVKQIDYVIATQRKALTSPSFTVRRSARRALIGALLQRTQFLGDIAAFDQALAVADEMLIASHELPDRHLFHAKVLAALHRFDEASAALDRAEAEGVSHETLEIVRIRLLLSRGQPSDALTRLDSLRRRSDSLAHISTRALVLADLGKRSAAEHEFDRAVSSPTLVDPLPVAYLWFQQGLMWEREGKRGKARELYARALERFPDYPALASHLAALEAEAGQTAEAIARLRTLVDKTSDPEYVGQLAALLRRSGKTAEADELAARAEAAYEALLHSHPLAFADHAARFYLDVVAKPARALELAAINLENRPTDEAHQLYLDAAYAAAAAAAAAAADAADEPACEVATRAAGMANATAYLLFASSRALRKCGRGADADAALARAAGAIRQR